MTMFGSPSKLVRNCEAAPEHTLELPAYFGYQAEIAKECEECELSLVQGWIGKAPKRNMKDRAGGYPIIEGEKAGLSSVYILHEAIPDAREGESGDWRLVAVPNCAPGDQPNWGRSIIGQDWTDMIGTIRAPEGFGKDTPEGSTKVKASKGQHTSAPAADNTWPAKTERVISDKLKARSESDLPDETKALLVSLRSAAIVLESADRHYKEQLAKVKDALSVTPIVAAQQETELAKAKLAETQTFLVTALSGKCPWCMDQDWDGNAKACKARPTEHNLDAILRAS